MASATQRFDPPLTQQDIENMRRTPVVGIENGRPVRGTMLDTLRESTRRAIETGQRDRLSPEEARLLGISDPEFIKGKES